MKGKAEELFNVGIAFGIILLFLPIPLNIFSEFKFLLLNLLGIILLFKLYGREFIIVPKAIVPLGIFIITVSISTCFASNFSIASYYSFGFFGVFVGALFLADYLSVEENRNFLLFVFQFIFLCLLFIGLLIILTDVSGYSGFGSWLGLNVNSYSGVLVLLSPFYFLSKKNTKYLLALKALLFFSVLFILYSTKSKAVIISLVIYYFVFLKHVQRRIAIPVIVLSIFAMMGFLLAINDFHEFSSKYGSARLSQFRISLDLFLDNMFLGIGPGNWIVYEGSYNLIDVLPYRYPFKFTQQPNHSFYAKLLSETGIIAFISFMVALVGSLYKGFRSFSKSSVFYRSFYVSFCISALFYSNFYTFSYFDINKFSIVFLLTVVALVTLSSTVTIELRNGFKKKVLFSAIFILMLTSVVYFSFQMKTNQEYLWSKELYREGDLGKAVQIMGSAYFPTYKTTFNNLNSIAHDMALLHWQLGDIESTEHYLNLALGDFPSNHDISYDLAKFLFYEKCEWSESEFLLEKNLRKRSNNYDSILLLTEIYLAKGEVNKAKTSLATIRLSPVYPRYAFHSNWKMILTNEIASLVNE